ncbi:hypothetical protein Tco_1441841, partial [Tanacetum coccineum]
GEVPLLELTRGRVVLLLGVNDQGDANIQGVVNEGSGDAAVADEIKESDHVVPYEGDNIVEDDEIQDIMLREEHGTYRDAGTSTAGKSLAVLQGLLDSSTLAVETQHLTERFVVFPDSSFHSSSNAADAEVSFVATSLSPDPPITTTVVATTVFVDPSSVLIPRADNDPVHHTLFAEFASIGEANQDIADMDSETLHQTYVPKLNVTNNPALYDPNVCRSVIDHLAPPVLFPSSHDLMDKKKLKGKCSRHASLLKERDAEMVSLKAQLSFKEAEAAKAIRLRGQIATVKAAEAARASELDGLKERNAALEGQVMALKSATDGLVAGIDHGKSGRGLVDVASYNPSAEANYVSNVNALRAVDFPLLSQLESQKDASIFDIMGLLHLEGPAAETPEANQLQASPEIRGDAASRRLSFSNAMFPLIEPLSAKNLVGEASTSGVLAMATTTAFSTTFILTIFVPSISVADYEVLGVELSTEVPSPPKIVFEKEELKTTPEHTTADDIK